MGDYYVVVSPSCSMIRFFVIIMLSEFCRSFPCSLAAFSFFKAGNLFPND